MIEGLVSFLILSVAVFIVAQVVPGIRVKDFGTAVLVALVYGVIHFLLATVLTILTFPLVLVTFGLFVFVINAFLLWITSKLIGGFTVAGLVPALIGALLLTIVNVILRTFLLVMF